MMLQNVFDLGGDFLQNRVMRILCLALPLFGYGLSYDVEFLGLNDKAAFKALQDASQLVHLQNRPPPSINGLRYRIASDIPELIEVLHAYAYYEAAITSEIQSKEDGYHVVVYIDPGPQYLLSSYEVFKEPTCKETLVLPECALEAPDLGLTLGKPALSVDIVNAELELLTQLSRCAHPLASVEHRKVEVDMEEKAVHAAACIQEGPAAKFGPTLIYGLKGVKPDFIEGRIAWKEGDPYDADRLEETQQRLLKTDLFSSVLISHGDELDERGELALKMRLSEVKHRQLSLGAFYATEDGFGGSLRWIHRNLRGMGEILSIDVDASKRWIAGLIVYKKPDFFRYNQTYRALAQLMRENIRPTYLAFTYRFANYIDRKIEEKGTMSMGLKIEHITVTKSANNNTYLLLGLPLSGKYDATDNELDPSRGFTVTYQFTPYQSMDYGHQHFVKQRLTGTCYLPIMEKRNLVLALRVQLGSIAGARQSYVPLSKLFLGGSLDELRGYRYKTVSPLNSSHQPLGGRSAIYATAEGRIRLTKTIGLVPFADFGTVSFSEVPEWNTKWYKSVGVGLRYFAYFGPLRFDIGFPLNKRSAIDPNFTIYAAVGQAF
ncbi:MAG: BamA/TamA family outer membrane protein [Chlamydiia bacterium]|nr:BamA/TamA family outer membrane protein [Chlamydiia bacterium]